jgi:type II secretory pathway predicted ATPase ExeA
VGSSGIIDEEDQGGRDYDVVMIEEVELLMVGGLTYDRGAEEEVDDQSEADFIDVVMIEDLKSWF